MGLASYPHMLYIERAEVMLGEVEWALPSTHSAKGSWSMWVEKAFTYTDVGEYGPHIRSPPKDWGSGRSLPPILLLLCTLATLFTTVASSYSIWLQLKHYFKPRLQRYVVRILIMYVTIILPQAAAICCLVHDILIFTATRRDD